MDDIRKYMTPAQLARLEEPTASASLNQVAHAPGADCYRMTGHFHMVVGLPVAETPVVPSVSERYLRANLILEEFLELLDAMGFQLEVDGMPADPKTCEAVHIEQSQYDLVETADALGDLNVVVNGTAVSFGIPMPLIDYEIYRSNLSKLDNDGKPIVNECPQGDACPDSARGDPCEHLPMPDAPLGKRLKGPNYVAPNIPAILVAYQNKEL